MTQHPMDIIKTLAEELSIAPHLVDGTVKLIDEGKYPENLWAK